jgi:saccharopine dehydrogenase-like NADP-dependent oxidoreductase
MRVLLVGAGGVGSAVVAIAARREFFEAMVVADYDLGRASRAVGSVSDARLAARSAAARPDARFVAARVDASSADAVAALCREHRITHVLNAVDPRFVMPIFSGARAAGADYLDMAMSLSSPHPVSPYSEPGVKLGDEQFAAASAWADAGRLALVGIGVEPGLSDVFARYAADSLFDRIDEIGVRDGANLVVAGYDFAPSFSIWTTIEECLNPPVIWERDRGWYTTEPFSEPEVFDFPAGIGPVECVNVEHEEVLLIPRWVDCDRVTFKYGLGAEFIDVLRTLHKLGLDRVAPVSVPGGSGGSGSGGSGRVSVSPRDVVAACLPDPATLGDKMTGKTCAGTWVRGIGVSGEPREAYLYHVVDNEWSMAEYGHQAVVWQTAINPVIALELLASGEWSGTGVLGPEAMPPHPFLNKLTEHNSPWSLR